VSGPVQRQQAKWVLFAFVAYELVLLGGFAIPSLFVNIDSPWFAWALVATLGFNVLFPGLGRGGDVALPAVCHRTVVPCCPAPRPRPDSAAARPRQRQS
jgi:hypothetical protein